VRHGTLSAEEAKKLGEPEALRLIFQPEVSTSPILTEISGRGIGLAIVDEKVEKLGGRVVVETRPRTGTTFRLLVPLTLATFRGTLVEAGGQTFVIPTANVERVLRVKPGEVQTVEGRPTIRLDEKAASFVKLED